MIRNLLNKLYFCVYLIIFSCLFLSRPALASNNILCTTNSTCTLGEFLYDDSYVPITSATCTLNGRDPDNIIFFNNVNAPHVSDGRYEKTISTTGLAVGEYQAQLCCVTGTQNLCIDKTFVISSQSLTQTSIDNAVTSIKGASNKDLSELSTQVGGVKTTVDSISTSMSTLVADIWTNSTTSLNTLLGNIWSTPNRSLTTATLSEGQLATTANIASAESSIKGIDNKDLSQISGQVTELKATTDSIFLIVNNLDLQISTISANVNSILGKWGTSSISDITNSLGALSVDIGTSSDTCALGTTVLSRLKCLSEKWGTETANSIYTAALNAQTASESLSAELTYSGKTTKAYEDLQTLNTNLNSVTTLIGTGSDTASSPTVFGKMKQIQDTVEALDTSSTDLSGLLAKWGDYTATDLYNKIKDISGNVSVVNTVSDVSSILSRTDTIITEQRELKNTVYSLQALIKANKTILDKTANQPIIQSWLEEGSIIFKNLITNPSTTSRQSVPLKFYLPKEATLNDIMKKSDPSLSVTYDTSQGAILVSGNFDLGPKESKILSVEVTDIWKISDTEIAAIQNQVSELFDVLKGTAYFAQGSTLKSDIGVSLEKIVRIQQQAKTPEARIMAFRTASDELIKVKSEIKDLKELVTSVSSNKSLFGFVGGSQLISVWGIVVIIVAGFAFLAIFIKNLIKSQTQKRIISTKNILIQDPPNPQIQTYSKIEITMLGIIILILITGGTVYFLNIKKIGLFTGEVKGVETTLPTTKTAPEILPATESARPKFVRLYFDIAKLTLRIQPNMEALEVTKAVNNETYTVLDKKNDNNGQEWYQLDNNKGDAGWGMSRFFETINQKSETNSNLNTDPKQVEIITTIPDTKVINIRSLPDITSKVIQRVSGGQQLTKISQNENWFEIEIHSTKEGSPSAGWIQKALISKP